ncbi:MAG: hypothetical protein PGN23_15815 [Sphingomonas adhaesiva]|uniref:hypothetical protein n=1 Tax=Sphingomonas adhaesiva TaxID=28212 RepID=UPI002FF77025
MRSRAAIGKRGGDGYARRVTKGTGMGAQAVRIGAVWDSTVEVLRGRAGILASLALLYLVVPAVAPSALALAGGGAWGGALVSLAQLVLVIVALLAIAAVASDPAVGHARAQAIGWRRLGAGVIASLSIGLLFVGLLIPVLAVAYAFGVRANEATAAMDVGAMTTAGLGVSSLVALGIAVLAIWLSARLLPVIPVVANEPLSFRSLHRSFALTGGAGWRLVGVSLLYLVVASIVTAAVTSVVGVLARLTLGEGGAALVIALVSGLVSAGLAVVQGVFAARFYVAARDAIGEGAA